MKQTGTKNRGKFKLDNYKVIIYLANFTLINFRFFLLISAAAAAAAGLNNSNPAGATGQGFPNATAGTNPYVITQDQQQYLAALAAGQLLPGSNLLRPKIEKRGLSSLFILGTLLIDFLIAHKRVSDVDRPLKRTLISYKSYRDAKSRVPYVTSSVICPSFVNEEAEIIELS